MSKQAHHKVTKSAKGHKACVIGSGPVILFRQIKGNKPCNWIDGLHWYVEYHATHLDMAFPLGMAFVTVPMGGMATVRGPHVDFIIVVDQCRREGIATALIDAIRNRWPDVWLTDAISSPGEALLRSLNLSVSSAPQREEVGG